MNDRRSPPDRTEQEIGHTHTADVRRAQQMLTALHKERARCVGLRERGTLSEQRLLDWQSVLLDCVEAIRPWRGRAGERWDRAGPDWLAGFDDLVHHTGAVEVKQIERVGFGRVKPVTKSQPQVLPFKTLLALSRELEDIAEDMGLADGPENNPDRLDAEPI